MPSPNRIKAFIDQNLIKSGLNALEFIRSECFGTSIVERAAEGKPSFGTREERATPKFTILPNLANRLSRLSF